MPDSGDAASKLSRQVGLFDATMIVMGGIIGAGIFMNPAVVARQLHTPLSTLAVWVAGGVIALLGAFVYAELADRLPAVGGQYAYLRDAYHPVVGFLYGWVLLLVIQTGGMAAVTVTFARYFLELTHLRASEQWVSVLTLAVLTVINCLGVKLGSRIQSLFMILKIVAIAALMGAGLFLVTSPHPIFSGGGGQPFNLDLVTAFGAGMIPVLFSYGGWQTSNFIAGEIKDPRQNLPRALLIGVAGVIILYVGVSFVCVRALGVQGLANTVVPASAVMRMALGERGATLIALGVAVSTVGFLSQSILTGPRVYFAMAEDRLFFPAVATVSKTTRVPVVAIVLQSTWAAIIALAGRYDQILNYVVSMDFIFFGLSATCLFVFRARERRRESGEAASPGFRVPGHPYTTLLFVASCWLVVLNTFYRYPANSLLGLFILLTGFPVYAFWGKHLRKARHPV